jgi:predicted MPP superfamily phosphohydrolase
MFKARRRIIVFASNICIGFICVFLTLFLVPEASFGISVGIAVVIFTVLLLVSVNLADNAIERVQNKILLSHDPTHWELEVKDTPEIDLMLSGHTHAMQFSLFGWSPSSFIFDEVAGLFKHNEQYLYVNIGLGETLMKTRIGTKPEITVIQLGVRNSGF